VDGRWSRIATDMAGDAAEGGLATVGLRATMPPHTRPQRPVTVARRFVAVRRLDSAHVPVHRSRSTRVAGCGPGPERRDRSLTTCFAARTPICPPWMPSGRRLGTTNCGRVVGIARSTTCESRTRWRFGSAYTKRRLQAEVVRERYQKMPPSQRRELSKNGAQ